MYRTVNTKNLWALRNLLEKKFKEIMAELPGSGVCHDGTKYFNHDFTKEKPYYEITLRVDLNEFDVKLMEAEIGTLRAQLKKRDEEIVKLKEQIDPTPETDIAETLIEYDDKVFAHQFIGNKHRLVECCKPPQLVGAWYPMDEVAKLGDYTCSGSGEFVDWS